MDFTPDPDVVAIADNLLRFIDREVLPLEHEHRALFASERTIFDESGRYVPKVLELRQKVRKRSAELGYYTMCSPEKLGGGGFGSQASAHIQEQVNHRYGPNRHLIWTVVLPSPFTNGLSPILAHLQPETLAKYRDDLASGRKTMCFGLSEPDAGSDAFGIKTTAVRDGKGWRISGTKQWITTGPYADLAMIFAVTDPEKAARRAGGITGFFVDIANSPGYSVASVIKIMGHLGSDIAILNLDNVFVPDDHVIGELDQGLKVGMDGINAGRLSMSACNVGLARWALDMATDYAGVRKSGGKTISEYQAIQFLLADCAHDIYASKSMIQNCAWRVDNGLPANKETSMVKLHATEMLNRVMDRCIQVHGGMGLTNELRLEDGYRFSRMLRIPDGTSEIQRKTIARELLRGNRVE